MPDVLSPERTGNLFEKQPGLGKNTAPKTPLTARWDWRLATDLLGFSHCESVAAAIYPPIVNDCSSENSDPA